MSKLSEYIEMIKNGFKNFDKVYEGIKTNSELNRGNLTQEEKEEIIRRRLICHQCPYMSKNAAELGLYSTHRDDEHCIHCGCNIEFKTACLSCNCGIEAYNEANPDSPLPLKWEKII